MAVFGTKSTNQVNSCVRDTQTILNEAIKYIDFSVVEGQRTSERQHEHWMKGRDLKHPDLDPRIRDNWKVIDDLKVVTTKDGYEKKSKHQGTPKSEAVDIVPYHTMWSVENKFYQLNVHSVRARSRRRRSRVWEA